MLTNINNVAFIQGDIMGIKIDQLPQGLKKREGNIIVRGESTGSHHSLLGGSVFERGEELYLQVIQPIGEVVHQEHNPIELPAGNYRVVRQRQYKKEDMTELVVD